MRSWKRLILLRIIMSKRSPLVRKKKYNIITRVLYAENILNKSLLFKLWLKLVEIRTKSKLYNDERTRHVHGYNIALLSRVFPDMWLQKKINNRELISVRQNEQAYTKSCSHHDNRRPDILSLLSKLTEFLFAISLFWTPLCSFTVKRGKPRHDSSREAHREILQISTIELSLQMLMTDLNIWISNNSKNPSYGSDSQYATGCLTKVFLLTFYAFEKDRILFCLKHSNMSKTNKGRHGKWRVTLEKVAMKRENTSGRQ